MFEISYKKNKVDNVIINIDINIKNVEDVIKNAIKTINFNFNEIKNARKAIANAFINIRYLILTYTFSALADALISIQYLTLTYIFNARDDIYFITPFFNSTRIYFVTIFFRKI